MKQLLQPATGAFILRISLGVVLLVHSLYLKGVVFTLAGTAQYFVSIGLPGFLAYVVFAMEAVAGVALVLGYQSRLASIAIVPVLVGALWAHSGNGWLFTNTNGGWEYPLFLVIAALVQATLGDGKFALANLVTRNGSSLVSNHA